MSPRSSLTGAGLGLRRALLGPLAQHGYPAAAGTPAAAIDFFEIAPENWINVGGALERHLARYFGEFGSGLPPPGLYQRILREVEVPVISAALGATRGNQIKAAELLGLNRNTLRKKIRELDIHVMRRSL